MDQNEEQISEFKICDFNDEIGFNFIRELHEKYINSCLLVPIDTSIVVYDIKILQKDLLYIANILKPLNGLDRRQFIEDYYNIFNHYYKFYIYQYQLGLAR